MQVNTGAGAATYGLAVVVLFILELVSIVGVIILFNRGHESYSIKYELFFKSGFFRRHPSFCTIVEVIYHIFFGVPFCFLVAIAIARAISNPVEFVTIILNGLIILLSIYPIPDEWFYRRSFVIWLLVIGAQFDTFYQFVNNTAVDTYSVLSSIFYPINAILFCLAILSNQNDYWELNNAIHLCREELKAIYQPFTRQIQEEKKDEEEKKDYQMEEEEPDSKIQEERPKVIQIKPVVKYSIPRIFDGGVYGSLCRNKQKRGVKRLILYICAVVALGLNAFLVWLGGSSLGIIGLITNIVYDIFIFAFAALKIEERTVRNIFFLVFLGRILSFIFGQQLWIFGYCFLYLIVGTFIGKILIQKKFPLRKPKKKKHDHKHHEQINALKTPEFVLLILTAQIFFLVLAASFGVGISNVGYTYTSTSSTSSTGVNIQLWMFALIAVMITWILILAMASYRIYMRQKNNIREDTQFYFGAKSIKAHHVAMILTYLLVVGLGLFCLYFLQQKTAFLSCLCLPLILMLLIKYESQWENNEYQILVDINEYNQRVRKAKSVIEKKQVALRQKANLNIHSAIHIPSTFKIPIQPEKEGETSKMMLVDKNDDQKTVGVNSQTTTQLEQREDAEQERRVLKQKLQGLEEKEHNWRQFQGKVGVIDWFNIFLTSSDRWLLILTLLITIVVAAYTVTTYIVAGTIFGMLMVLCIGAILTHSPFFRYSRTFKDLVWYEYVWYYLGWVAGAVYWAVYRQDTVYVMVWSIFYILVALAMIIQGFLRNIKRPYIYVMTVNIFLTMVFICIILYLTVQVFTATLVTVVLVLLSVGAIPIAYSTLENRIPTAVKVICGLVIGIGVAAIAILGFVFNVASNFAIFSFVMGALYVVLFLIASIMYFDRENNKYQTPHVYSSYGRPIYKFQSRVQKLKSSISHKIVFNISTIMLVIYAAGVTLLFSEKQYAIYALGYYACIKFLQDTLFAIKTQNELAVEKSKVSKELMSTALKELNDKYMVDFHSSKYSKDVEKVKYELKEKAEQAEDEDLEKAYAQLAKKHYQFIARAEEEQKFLFFWIALIQFQLYTQEKLAMVKFINQVKEIQPQLIQYGIFVESVNFAISDFNTKYELITEEIDGLHPFDFVTFKDILDKHQRDSLLKSDNQKKLAEDIEKEQEKREEAMLQNLKQELNKSSNDKINEYNLLLNQIQPKKRYVDEVFTANERVLGPGLGTHAKNWRRPKKSEMLVKGGFSPYDIKQGLIGDCYLISSMGVLGEKWIKMALGGCREEGQPMSDQEWKNHKGAYMVRFFKFLKEVYITIDDLLPVDEHGQFVFAKSEDQEEIWPCIIEKAYAKLYGGYDRIVEGKCHRVFAQFTGGFPSELLTQNFKSNPNSLWQKILNSKQNQYLMAAGSPSHADGDRAHSARGIVQGHAYAVLDVREVEDHKLMKLKNPHGSGGIEWNGDFADDSQMMSKRLMQILQHEKKDDGVFWMKFEDFIYEFKSLYLCAIFSEQKWMKFPLIQGKFTQQNSWGLPTSSQNSFKNPQFGITVTKQCTFFVNMVQQALNSIKGKNTIYLRIQMNDGKRISMHNCQADLVCGNQLKATNAITLSNEAVLESFEYPYTFTLFISTEKEGEIGDFKLQMFCSDKEAVLIEDKDFDREEF